MKQNKREEIQSEALAATQGVNLCTLDVSMG